MAITKSTVTYLNGVTSWLQSNAVPTYFASVVYDGTKIICKDANNNTLLSLNYSSATIYKNESGYDDKSLNFSSDIRATYICVKCGGGILIFPDPDSPAAHSNKGGIIITKTNNGKVAVIAGGDNASLAASCSNGVVSAAWGDDASATKTITYTPASQNQTQLVPFSTYAPANSVSYTTNAFFLLTTQYSSIVYGEVENNGAKYITNGYWAIKDVV